ncbi:uncharacterized protein LOC128177492 [Crassostrea angulata]|uniref:uncharacterized protein LOC128177492 n=1 Tax=Magallana angulata TaxID=2784310 RepID=UPI0022B08B56|nr:uncharacterized protein LOC128177492 [Crassostrea angulata]
MALQKMSGSVYVGMCHEIGTPQQVASRRNRIDELELLVNQELKDEFKLQLMMSGSRKEGFRFRGSDVDIMYWPTDHQVIWDFSQIRFNNIQSHVPVFCDSSESPPGFTLLKIPVSKECAFFLNRSLKDAFYYVMKSCVEHNKQLCISSSKYREIIQTISFPGSGIHGPCSSGTLGGGIEYDQAYCFVSKLWPPSASSWKDRCLSWPSPDVVDDIVRSGCHFVAIGHKLGNHEDNEWRISFSQAEYKLVYSMNHTQFLIYGLLKVFLKEIINKGIRDEEKLLCSYHMKTALFWAIQQNALKKWSPQNLLGGFWVCFKLLLKWVYEGACPNFFIPANNMFLSKIFGMTQQTFFGKLNGLYERGIGILLNSESIQTYMISVLCNPRLEVCLDVQIREVALDTEIFLDIAGIDVLHLRSIGHGIRILQHPILQSICFTGSQFQMAVLQKLAATMFPAFAFLLFNTYSNKGGNKMMYIVDKISCHLLKLATKCGIINGMLYIAMYYYKTCRYREALSIIEMTKVKLSQPCLMYKRHVNLESYTKAVGGKSLSTKMRQALLWDIPLSNEICYISELQPEQQHETKYHMHSPLLYIPHVVLFHMLEYLCYRQVDYIKEKEALDDLEFLVHHDQGQFVPEQLRDISWEILGICQQMAGHLQDARYSYEQSLKQDHYNQIEHATKQRIRELNS